MGYVYAFVGLVGFGLAVNYLIQRLFGRQNSLMNNKQINPALQVQAGGFPGGPADSKDDLLFREMKEEISKEVQDLKFAVKELMDDISLKSRELKEKGDRLEDLIKIADARLEELNKIKELPADHDWGEPYLNNLENFSKVRQLHKQGMDKVAIAKNLGMGIGEVELRIGLLNKVCR